MGPPISLTGATLTLEAAMAFTAEEIHANRDYFNHKLRAEKQRSDVLHAVEGEHPFDFTLLDARGREAFSAGHIPGAICAPWEELEQLAPTLPKDGEIVTYCWGHD
jgi:3-mercaptopyruvate sulfurtransferase SseA